MDVKCDFLNGDITEDIYMQKTKGFVTNPYFLCMLKKSLYGLKKAPRAWYVKIDGFLLSLSFVRYKSDPNVYLNLIHGSLMIVLYVDDLLIKGSSKKEIASLKNAMNHAFSMTDLGLLSQFLGIKIAQSQNGIKLHQSRYTSYFLIKFIMKYFKLRKIPFLSGVNLEEWVLFLW